MQLFKQNFIVLLYNAPASDIKYSIIYKHEFNELRLLATYYNSKMSIRYSTEILSEAK